jgi:hypothetical protein
MGLFGPKKQVVTMAVDAKHSNVFLLLLEKAGLFTDVSGWRLEEDETFRVYEFEATQDEYYTIDSQLSASNVDHKIPYVDPYGETFYIGFN